MKVSRDSNEVAPILQKPLRYGKLPELHHTFKADPKNPPKIISLFFGAIVLAALPALLLAVHLPEFRHFADPIVAFPRGKRQPHFQGFLDRPCVSRAVFWLHSGHGGHLLQVLHFLDAFSDSTGGNWHWICHFSQRKQSFN